MESLTQTVKNLGGVISKNSPTILTGAAVAGLITTTILGIKATPKAISVLDDYTWNLYLDEGLDEDKVPFSEWVVWKTKNDPTPKKDIFKLTWKLFIPTVAVGTATIICIIGSNRISLRRNAALASLYGLTQTAFSEYKAKVVETIGKNKELKVRDDISGDRVKNNPPSRNEVILTGKGEVLCYDSLSGRYFKMDIEKLRKIINELNRDLISDMFLSLNELYDAIGLDRIKLGEDIGWDVNKGMIEIDFSAQLTEDDTPCIVINYNVEPKHI